MTPYTKDIVESAVTNMKSSGSITSVSNVDTLYTINTPDVGNIQVGFKVKIGSNYLRVSAKTFNTFQVTSTVDLSSELTWEMYIDFLFGSKKEIATKIKNVPNTKTDQKFDVIWLLNVITGSTSEELIDRIDNVTIAIVTDTLREYTSEQRLANIFKVRLNPLYDLFVSELSKLNTLVINRGENLDINKQEIYLYNSGEGSNVLNESTDAIELETDLSIKKVFENEIC